MVPWYIPWSDLLKKKVCRYLLQRYLGQFLEEKLRLEQLNVELYNGKGTVSNVALYPEALNELCESQGWGIEVTGGHIGSVTVTVPWNALMTNDSHIEVSELFMTIRPRARQTDGTSMLESMWSSVSSSMQLAQECLEKEVPEFSTENAQNAGIEGLEKFAQTIDNVLNRIKAKLLDSTIRLEYLPPKSERGIAIIIKIKKLEYKNEAGADLPDMSPSNEQEVDVEQIDGQKTHLISTYATHNIRMEGITFYTEEFRIVRPKEKQDTYGSSTQFLSTISQLPETEQFLSSDKANLPESDSDDDADSKTESEKRDPDAEMYNSKAIQFCSWESVQEIRLKMKQSESIPGPKVYLELSFGALRLFLTPRQVHLITAYCDAFSSGGSSRKEAKHDRAFKSSKRLRDMKRSSSVGQYNAMTGAISNDGWSCADEEMRQLQISQQSSGYREHSKSIDISESMDSSMTSSTSTTNSAKIRKRGTNINISGDISHYTLYMSSVSLLLLHEDILVECTLGTEGPLSEESVNNLYSLSATYFGNKPVDTEYGNELLKKSHIKLNLSPIIMDGEEQRNNSTQLLKFTVSVPRVDFAEVLDGVEIPLIKFLRNEACSSGDIQRRPELRLAMKYITPTVRRTGSKRRTPAKTEIMFNLESAVVELDVSLYDRLDSLLNATPFCSTSKSTRLDSCGSSKSNESSSTIELKVESPSLDVRLRFPINDSRPLHDENRIPWWKRNVREAFLLFAMQRFRFYYNLPSVIELLSNEIDIFYCESVNSSKIHIGKTSLIEKTGARLMDSVMEFPKLRLEFPSEKVLRTITKRMTEDGSDSGDTSGESYGAGTIYASKRQERSPFSSKRVCRESGTPHHKENSDDSETFIFPGDVEEMKRFRETSMQMSKVQVQLYFPVASIQINSKHLYEVIYNLLNTDLLMWKPSAPSNRIDEAPVFSSTMNSFLTAGMMDSIYIPSTRNESEVESETSSSGGEDVESGHDSDTMYYSTYDRKHSSRRSLSAINQIKTNSCSFSLDIGKGVLTLFAPVRGSDNNVIPGQLGEFVISINSLALFSVSGYQENTNHAYVCLQATEAELRHCGLIPAPNLDPPLRLFGQQIPEYLLSTIYPSPSNLTLRRGKGSIDREMISLAIQIKAVPDQRVKRICVTMGLQNTTLRHYPTLSQHTWLNQMIDMIDVLDYPIEGYIPYGVVTEMQLHLWDCSIDYRPLYFPYRAVLDLGYFMISSNLTTSLPGCTLRFIAEECAICLAPNESLEEESKEASNEFLVSVVDVGLLEISLRINEKATSLFPKLDLRAFIQSVHIRTCSDSGQALAQLIGYFAADSDIKSTTLEIEPSCPMLDQDEDVELLPMRKSSTSIPEVTPKQQERVNTLMADAMQESVRMLPDSDEENRFDAEVEVFFFPDEAQKLKSGEEEKPDKIQTIEQPEVETVDETTQPLDPPPANELPQPTKVQLPKRSHDHRSDSQSSNELRDILNFESSILATSYMIEDETVEALPQIKNELGEISMPSAPPKSAVFSKKMSSDTDEDYCIIAEEEKALLANFGVKKLDLAAEPIRIVDNHFSVPVGKPDLLRAPPDFPMAVTRYTLCEMTVTWHLHGGHDFPKKDEYQADKEPQNFHVSPGMSKIYTSGVSYTKGQPGVTFCKKPIPELSWKTRGGRWRKHDILVEIQINKVRISHEIYPTNTLQASRQVLLITELEVRDKLQSSDINKFLYHPPANNLPKKSSQHMVVIKALHLRPNPVLPAQECCLRVSLLPLRLNIDQDTLLFLVDYFTELGAPGDGQAVKKAVVPHHPPVMIVDDIPEALQDLQARKMVSENLMLLMEEEKEKEPIEPVSEDNSDMPIYFKEVIFSPEVTIRLDYHGRRIELSRGPVAGLLMGLGQLQCSEIRLKRVCYRNGLLGMDRLLNFLFKEWLQDIKKNQLPSILSGVGPMYSFIQLFQGIRDLFWLPIEQYQKDGRIVRGLQLGAQSFTARTALAALEITARLIQLLQLTAETAYDMVSPGPSVKRTRNNRKGKRKRMHRPQDIREGVANAYQIVKEGIGATAQTLRDVTIEERDQKGYTGAVGAVVRQIPPMVVCPVVLVTQATTNILDGMQKQLIPEARREAREKWKEDDQ